MAEYIDRQKVLDLTKTFALDIDWVEDPMFLAFSYVATNDIKYIPAADVWEVVHCADCAHAEESMVSGCVYCNEMERARIKEGFCAWGERKTKDG